jgi:hypothetical protein
MNLHDPCHMRYSGILLKMKNQREALKQLQAGLIAA